MGVEKKAKNIREVNERREECIGRKGYEEGNTKKKKKG